MKVNDFCLGQLEFEAVDFLQGKWEPGLKLHIFY
jgi:hypothetical protein